MRSNVMVDVSWDYNSKVSAEEFIVRFANKLSPIIQTMQQNDGDLFISEYQKLVSLGWKIQEVSSDLKGKGNE
tara:strand:+ start:287 stop:505 length:219 start_codon:yes stop_codon:yes gene_type:complete